MDEPHHDYLYEHEYKQPLPPHAQQQQQGRISPEQLEELIRRGLRPDLALLPYQMPRLDHNGIPPPPPVDTGLDTRWIKSHGNLVRGSLRHILSNNRNQSTLIKIAMMIDASAPCVMVLTINGDDRRGAEVNEDCKKDHLVQKVVQVHPGIGQELEVELDLELKELESMSAALALKHSKFGVPLVIRLEKKRDLSPSKRGSLLGKKNVDDASIKTEVDAQITYAVFLPQPVASSPVSQQSPSPSSVGLVLKVMRQVVQVGNRFYTMKEIYGSKRGRSNSSTAMNSDCVICMCNYANTAVLPCRHMCLCQDCATLLRSQSNKCPICRSHVLKLLKIERRQSFRQSMDIINDIEINVSH
eukprot:TRINITY_DN22787_c0_g1_i1.p1 TRINITY_DN22787_c0_g1~~TRINITY_DN22787_c0_g1_i1.p1  ORF type:complete len:391 (+),score=60.04 TRINITY_DN22787_c0_g1_i1:104-1174(+)